MDRIDITGRIGRLYPDRGAPEWPMVSYDRPAYLLWDAIANELHDASWSEERIRDWLKSKAPRWALDGDLGDQIRTLGQEWGKRVAEEGK